MTTKKKEEKNMNFKQALRLTVSASIIAASISCMFLIIMISGMLAMDKINLADYRVGMKNTLLFRFGSHEITDKAVDACKASYTSQLGQVKCVNSFFFTLYNYDSNSTIESADGVLAKGADCKGSAAWYDYALNRLAITHWYSTEPGHIYVKAQINVIDTTINCGQEGEQFVCKTGEDYLVNCDLDEGRMVCRDQAGGMLFNNLMDG
jgi:hypothetical protein